MSKWGLCDAPLAEVRFEDGEYTGEFGAMMGVNLPPEKTENSIILNQSAVKDADTEQHTAFKETLAAEGIANPCYYYQNKSVNGPRVMMYGDSMFGSWNATELLAENFSEFSYVWDRNIRDSLLQKMRPDIVIYELTERYLNVLPDQNVSFLEQPLSDYSAEILACEIRNNKIFATVKNTSNSPWNWLDRVRLGIFSDGSDTGLRADLEANVSVQPGASVQFCMSLESYPDFLDNILEIQMLQEGLRYFGEKAKIPGAASNRTDLLDADIVSTTAPTTVNHTSRYDFEITVKNTGTQPWSESQQNRLCIWQDGADWGYRLYLPDGVTVEPGDTYTFVLQGFVLPEADSTYLEFQMLQEGACYFGEKQRVDIKAHF